MSLLFPELFAKQFRKLEFHREAAKEYLAMQKKRMKDDAIAERKKVQEARSKMMKDEVKHTSSLKSPQTSGPSPVRAPRSRKLRPENAEERPVWCPNGNLKHESKFDRRSAAYDKRRADLKHGFAEKRKARRYAETSEGEQSADMSKSLPSPIEIQPYRNGSPSSQSANKKRRDQKNRKVLSSSMQTPVGHQADKGSSGFSPVISMFTESMKPAKVEFESFNVAFGAHRTRRMTHEEQWAWEKEQRAIKQRAQEALMEGAWKPKPFEQKKQEIVKKRRKKKMAPEEKRCGKCRVLYIFVWSIVQITFFEII